VRRKIELLAPGGDVDSIKAAIVAGADAVFCGLDKFNARNRAANISFDNLQGILSLAHKNNCAVFLTLNIVIVDSEFPALVTLLNKLVNTRIDGVIVQDLGLFYLLNNHFKSLKIHASTQLTTHNRGQIPFLSKLKANRVNLSRELNIHEIKNLTEIGVQNNVLTEVFVHGSYCLSFSGLCYMSSVHGGRSGNRGRCSQPCRDRYLTTAAGKDFPLNLKDNSAYFDLKELYAAGVASLKIEGRIKEFEYVYTVVNSWRKQMDRFYKHDTLLSDNSELYKVFNRDFSNGFLQGDIHKDMFIDNPMSHCITHLSVINEYSTDEKLQKDKLELHEEKAEVRILVQREIDRLNIEKIPLQITVSGKSGEPLKIEVQTPATSFAVVSKVNLENKGTEALSREMIFKRLKSIDETAYCIEHFESKKMDANVYLPFKELTSLKKRLLFVLNDSMEMIAPVSLPSLRKQNGGEINAKLSVLISSESDVLLCNETNANLYFQLPNSFKNKCDELVSLFQLNKKLIPWFPSVLIGDDYDAAVDFLKKVHPKTIVTNNTGIAFEAYENEISWIAGPFLNITNSYSLLSLKENFNCSGAFISNELNKVQIRNIKKPADFELHYSIYHPIVLMTSRQCLFHQVSGCTKSIVDDSCISNCSKSSTITNLKSNTFFIEKEKGNFHTIYNQTNFLNTEILKDLPNFFSGVLIDLRDVKTETKTELDKLELISLFENHLNGNFESAAEIEQFIRPTTNTQYQKGI
jgi:putative protease